MPPVDETDAFESAVARLPFPVFVVVLQVDGGKRYEVIHSTRSPKGGERWLMLILRPFLTAAAVSQAALRER